MKALLVLRDAVAQTNRYLGLMMLSSVTATLASAPIVVVAILVLIPFRIGAALPIVLIALIGVFPSPAAAGVQFVAHETAHRNPVFWRDQIDGIRLHGWLALRCWVVSSVVGGLLAINAAFYLQHHFPLAGGLAFLCLSVLAWC